MNLCDQVPSALRLLNLNVNMLATCVVSLTITVMGVIPTKVFSNEVGQGVAITILNRARLSLAKLLCARVHDFCVT